MRSLIIIVLVIITTSCNSGNRTRENSLKDFDWLIGKWINVSEKGNATETWMKINDTAFSGESFFLVDNDTVSSEIISLEYLNGQIYYIPTVSNQNERMPVKFKLTSSSENKWVFENPIHDFPQKISYQKISDDSLVAEISGLINEKMEVVQFPMKREK